ncbi:MAG TPA: TetR/AcrR family transcriptional regulator [Blastocatellia bacterium]|nr:TetR/AcrR family transcriptional regulator [Blastocatellia bacterium]
MASTSTGRAPATRMAAVDRRQQIVSVASELFSKNGFNGTTTKEIADRAGVSEAIIFRHFPTKQALYSAIIDFKTKQSSERLQSHLKEAASRKDDLAFFGSLALDLLEVHKKDPTFMRLLMFSALEGHELAEMFYQSTAREVRNHVRRYIKQRIADGAFQNVDPSVAARSFVGMILYHAQVRVLYVDTSVDDIRLSSRQMAERLTSLFMNGICRRRR